jgi:hypothetical protein
MILQRAAAPSQCESNAFVYRWPGKPTRCSVQARSFLFFSLCRLRRHCQCRGRRQLPPTRSVGAKGIAIGRIRLSRTCQWQVPASRRFGIHAERRSLNWVGSSVTGDTRSRGLVRCRLARLVVGTSDRATSHNISGHVQHRRLAPWLVIDVSAGLDMGCGHAAQPGRIGARVCDASIHGTRGASRLMSDETSFIGGRDDQTTQGQHVAARSTRVGSASTAPAGSESGIA